MNYKIQNEKKENNNLFNNIAFNFQKARNVLRNKLFNQSIVLNKQPILESNPNNYKGKNLRTESTGVISTHNQIAANGKAIDTPKNKLNKTTVNFTKDTNISFSGNYSIIFKKTIPIISHLAKILNAQLTKSNNSRRINIYQKHQK